MIERKSFYQKDPLIGTVSFSFDQKHTGTLTRLAGGNLELTVEVLPPASLKCMTVPGKRGNYIAAMWLNMDNEHLGEVDKMQYDLGPDWYIQSFLLNPFQNFGYTISIFAPQPVKARVDFTGGSTVNLAAFCDSRNQTVDSPADHYFLARAYMGAGDPAAALTEIDKSIQGLDTMARSHSLKGDVLAGLGRFNDAEKEYKEAIRLTPDAADVLNSYAWMIADTMPSPQRSQLLDAKAFAEHAVQMRPDYANYDTLGWVEFKLGENEAAQEALRQGESLCTGRCRSNDAWQEVEYHLGKLYTALRKEKEAKKAFQAVIKYQQEYPAVSENKYVEGARAALKSMKEGA
jgi:Tfp pilus assembly protein PilF